MSSKVLLQRAAMVMLLVLSRFSMANAQCTWFVKIASGVSSNHSVGIKSDGTLWAWGQNDFGQLGDGTNTNSSIPIQIGTATNWVSIAVSGLRSLGIKSDGTLWAWGKNDYGQLGDGTITNITTGPKQIGTGTDWVTVAAGVNHSLGIKRDGTLWAWGWNINWNLGDGTATDRRSPTQIGTATNWVSVAAGYLHSLGIKSDGTLWAWGSNNSGALGDPAYPPGAPTPIQIGTATNWVSIAAGNSHTVGVRSDGTLWAWGHNGFGELGVDPFVANTIRTPTQIGANTNWVSVSAGAYYNLVLKNDGTLWSCGYGGYGQLGQNPIISFTSTLTQVGVAINWLSATAGDNHSFGIKADGSTYGWGLNTSGQVGNGTTTNVTGPALIGASPNLTLAAANSSSTKTQASITIYNNNCDLLANVVQTGSTTAISGSTTAKVWLAPTQPAAYVKRHYEITPAANATTATGRVTLYYTQQEFTDFNAVNTQKLPIDAIDAANNKNNLRIEKQNGTSGDGSGLPGTYNGATTTIDPADASIVWNSTNNRWEVTFDVTGFGGFFVKTQITPLAALNILDKVGLTNSVFASPAYSLRLLSSTYTGNAIRVRRSSDNATQDIGFTANGDLDTTSLKTFVGANDGYVTQWYDQSGNVIDAVQTTTANQPRIVSAGIVERINQRPAIYFGTANLATGLQTIFTTAASMVGVAKGNSSNPSALITKTGTVFGNNLNFPGPFDYTNSGAQLTVGNAATTTYSLVQTNSTTPRSDISNLVPESVYSFVIPATGTYYTYVNGMQAGSQTVNAFSDGGNALMIGNRNDGGNSGNLWTPEIILFNSVLSTVNRNTVEASQTTYYLSNSPLPLNWLSVKGQLTENNAARITWQVNEHQVQRYQVEKSKEGVVYNAIGYLSSKGDGTNDYSFTEPQMLSGANFYRIRQTDLDGRFTYSPVIKLTSQAISQVIVFPNPAKDFVTVTVGDHLLNTEATLHDVNGKRMQSLTISAISFTIDLENYPAGVYFLKTADGKVAKIIRK